MDKKKKISKKRKRLIRKIALEITNCEIEDKAIIFNMVAEKVGIEKFFQENKGIRILFDVIDDDLLHEINKCVTLAIEKTKLDLNSDSDSDSK